MVLDKLGSTLKETLAKIARSVFVDEKLINELVKDIQRALLQADVNVKLVFDLSQKIKSRIKEEQTPSGLTKKEHLINIVYEELAQFLGGEKNEIILTEKKPFKIMMVGLFGSGKTTTIGKLAKYYAKRGKKIAVLGLDVWRPAAMTQLEQNAKLANVPCFIDKKEKDPIKIWKHYEPEYAKYDILIIDTAGRDALNEELIEELNKITKIVQPDETLLVISADIGQTAQKQAQQFHDTCSVQGVVVTKMDGTAKGGGALSACAVTQAHIKFIGVGEKIDDLESFNPQGFVGRLLGMGDLEALLEKAKEAMNEEDAEDMSKRFLKGEFTLIDLYDQMQAMKKMGPLAKVMEMIPGMGQMNIPKELLQNQEVKLETWKYLLDSCTREELENADILDNNRIERIAKGSGRSILEVRELLKQYKQAKKMAKLLKGQDPDKMMKNMQKGGGLKGLPRNMIKSMMKGKR
ncbi:signal recognition particle protein Srp54 [Candidatus Woesearchaeota archaeon]|nr:signal recognition particle protein Srp54 [Candidatus Woesearchaeota archaeon]